MFEQCGDIYVEMNRRTIPYAVNLELTAACTLDCIHCYHVRTSGPEMGTSELFRILDELAGLGTMELTLTGGEPLARPDFPAILRYAVERRGFAVKIFSNLTLLDVPAADLIAALPVRRVETTLLGPDAGLHDLLTRRAGSFDAAIRGIRLLVERSVRVAAKTVVLRENYESLDDMYRLAGQLGIPFRHDDGVFVETGGGRGPLGHCISERETVRLRKRAGRRLPVEKSHFYPARARTRGDPDSCNAGKSVMGIAPDGSVYPCGPFPVSAGSVRERPLGEIWRDSPLMARVRSLGDSDYRVCGRCRYLVRCGGCMAMGWGLSSGRMYPCRLMRRRLRQFT
jgi:radical SAM protein with 4Fe4S-binding SPASM domain